MMSAPVVSGTVIQATPVDQPTVVTVPPGVSAGQMMQVANPATGAMMQVAVPKGCGPGSQFQVQFPAAAPPPAYQAQFPAAPAPPAYGGAPQPVQVQGVVLGAGAPPAYGAPQPVQVQASVVGGAPPPAYGGQPVQQVQGVVVHQNMGTVSPATKRCRGCGVQFELDARTNPASSAAFRCKKCRGFSFRSFF